MTSKGPLNFFSENKINQTSQLKPKETMASCILIFLTSPKQLFEFNYIVENNSTKQIWKRKNYCKPVCSDEYVKHFFCSNS